MAAVRPAIYVATLNDYNNGVFHGAWIDALLPMCDIELAIDRVRATSPTARRTGEPARAWAIHDYEGFADLIDPQHDLVDVVAAAWASVDARQASNRLSTSGSSITASTCSIDTLKPRS